MLNTGFIGYGYWGPNLVRNFAESPRCQVIAVSDLSTARLEQAAARYPGVQVTVDHRTILANPAIEAVVIATPVSTHHALVMEALRAGKHVWVEKPLAGTVADAEEMVAEARRCGKTLMVDHTFLYSGAIRKIKELIDEQKLGQIYYYDSVRVNLGLFQHDSNVLWDLAVHDLAILDYLLPDRPTSVIATGIANVPGQPENMAYLTCFFDSNVLAHIHVNWLSPVKIRRTLIGGDRQMVCYDELEPSEKVKIYDRGIIVQDDAEDIYKMKVGYRTGDMWAPQLELKEALRVGVGHFVDCIETGRVPISDGESGLRVVKLLEAATHSLAHRGLLVDLREPASR